MPQLGPDILHRPLVLPDLSSLGSAVRWLAEGATLCLPNSIRNKGWRTENTLYTFSPDGELKTDCLIEKSWAGATRRLSASEHIENLPAAISLAPELVFISQTDLPLAARSTLDKTIALRMDELSPIPPEEAAFAIGAVVPHEDRLHVELAITRRKTIDDAKTALNGLPVSTIGASQGGNDAFRFVFSEGKEASHRWRKWLLASAILWVSVLLMLDAFSGRQERMLSSLDEHQTALRQELRELAATKEDAALLQQFGPSTFTMLTATKLAKSALGGLPEDAVIIELSLIGDQVTVTGLTPPPAKNPEGNFSRHPSDYPGYERFTFSAPLQQPKIAEAPNE